MKLIDRLTRTALRLRLGRRSTALLETISRKTGARRVTPVTNGLDGDVFWIVTEHGHNANYVRNIPAGATAPDRGRERTSTRKRSDRAQDWNQHLVIRIDLEPR